MTRLLEIAEQARRYALCLILGHTDPRMILRITGGFSYRCGRCRGDMRVQP